VRSERPAWVVLQCEAITDIDVTAAGVLEQLDQELDALGVHLAFAELRDRLQDLLHRYGLFETLDRSHFFPTIKAAVKEVQAIGPLPPSHDAAGRHARHEARPKVDHGKHDHGRHDQDHDDEDGGSKDGPADGGPQDAR
jgi:hypothetical protein